MLNPTHRRIRHAWRTALRLYATGCRWGQPVARRSRRPRRWLRTTTVG